MRYIGGKSRIAKSISTTIVNRHKERNRYVEPFVGGGAVCEKLAPYFKSVVVNDLSTDLIMMWSELASGWVPPKVITQQDYMLLKNSDPSALRGLVGFGGSFGGKWFGGYAKGGYQSNGEPRNHQWESARAAMRIASVMKSATITNLDYADIEIYKNDVVYCDPPYKATQGYSAVDQFDHNRFWKTMHKWVSIGAHVYVSEYVAPKNWLSIWESQHRMSLTQVNQGRPLTVEKLFVNDGPLVLRPPLRGRL